MDKLSRLMEQIIAKQNEEIAKNKKVSDTILEMSKEIDELRQMVNKNVEKSLPYTSTKWTTIETTLSNRSFDQNTYDNPKETVTVLSWIYTNPVSSNCAYTMINNAPPTFHPFLAMPPKAAEKESILD